MFDHSYCQNVHSQSQNRCFKEFANFRLPLQCKLHTVQQSKGFPTLISPEMGTAAELMIQEERINHFP